MKTRNRNTIAAVLGILVAGSLMLTTGGNDSPSASLATPLVYEQAIGGNAALSPEPDCYLTICLPKNWQSDATCKQLIADTAKPNFARLRRAATTKIYIDGNPDFEHRFQSDSNSGPIKTLPAVLVQSNGETTKWSGERVLRAEVELDTRLRSILCHPRPKPEPTPTDEPAPTSIEEPIPDLPDEVPPPESPLPADDNTLGIVLSALVGGVVAWLAMFNRKT